MADRRTAPAAAHSPPTESAGAEHPGHSHRLPGSPADADQLYAADADQLAAADADQFRDKLALGFVLADADAEADAEADQLAGTDNACADPAVFLTVTAKPESAHAACIVAADPTAAADLHTLDSVRTGSARIDAEPVEQVPAL